MAVDAMTWVVLVAVLVAVVVIGAIYLDEKGR